MKYKHTKPYEDWFWEKNRIHLLKDHVIGIDSKTKILALQSGVEIRYDKLVIARGSVFNKRPFPGADLQGVQSLYRMPVLDLMERNTRGITKAVIIGGGLIDLEMAEYYCQEIYRLLSLLERDLIGIMYCRLKKQP